MTLFSRSEVNFSTSFSRSSESAKLSFSSSTNYRYHSIHSTEIQAILFLLEMFSLIPIYPLILPPIFCARLFFPLPPYSTHSSSPFLNIKRTLRRDSKKYLTTNDCFEFHSTFCFETFDFFDKSSSFSLGCIYLTVKFL